ncbi:hypothetical protein CAI21_17965 [Alkalilimnicola ehrlichii]|uniref:Uncharacterized protein n=1 Tax=Alkalilimnicola ehrlichii TaxID=351052 RepID=A0A3E0WLS4_9GAMM|nr:hypothetical protein [Alkalilimnicola ehrlichii]RFA25845.1 hypothetical protein CAI21_17965 [Alkalilimnicola ehrlichii]RFA33101.1 hypothetical protein CAL65_18220 [Alkalilimnicola ehrlichii]
MSKQEALWQRLLQVEKPWRVLKYERDEHRQQHFITIGPESQRSWFGLVSRPAEALDTINWRHRNFGDWEVHLKVQAPTDADLSQQPWQGGRNQPFTNALAQEVFAMLREELTLTRICKLTGIPIADLWRFQYALDNGEWSPARSAAGSATPRADSSGPSSPPDGDIPNLNHPVWADIAKGGLEIDTRVLSLKMLLARLRSQLQRTSDEEVMMLKLQELRRYFVNNRRLLVHELKQLRGYR